MPAVLAVGTPATAAAVVGSARPAVDVIGDDQGDRFVGSGGLVLPGTIGDETRQRVATCGDCRWRLADPCAVSGDLGAHAACLSVTRGCARGASLLRVWVSDDAGATWRDLGLVCIPPGGPVTVADVGRKIRGEFERLVPSIGIEVQPARGVLPYVPVIFDSTQPASIEPTDYAIDDTRVTLTPRPAWTWEFGDGGVLHTAIPGSRYPNTDVSHSFGRTGRMTVRVTATWSATYTINGLGPFRVSLPITQEATTVVNVGQARAVLVP